MKLGSQLRLFVSAGAIATMAGCASQPPAPEAYGERHPGSVAPLEIPRTVFSPDGSKLYFDRTDKSAAAKAAVWIAKGPLQAPTRLTDEPTSVVVEEISTDGALLALQTSGAEPGDTGLKIMASNGGPTFEVEPIVHGRRVSGAWFDNANETLYYVIASANEQRSWLMAFYLKPGLKRQMFTTEGLLRQLDVMADRIFLFRRDPGTPGSDELLVWLGMEEQPYSVKGDWLARASQIKFALKADEFYARLADADGVNRIYQVRDNQLTRVSDKTEDVSDFLVDHRRFRLYLVAKESGAEKMEALDPHSLLPYPMGKATDEPRDLRIDRASRYGRFVSFKSKSGMYVYDWKDEKTTQWLPGDELLP